VFSNDLTADLTADQARRFRIWRSLTEMTRAQSAGALTDDQIELLRALVGSLQALSWQLSVLGDLHAELVRITEQLEPPSANVD